MKVVRSNGTVLEMRGSGTLAAFGLPLIVVAPVFVVLGFQVVPDWRDPLLLITIGLAAVSAVVGLAVHLGWRGCIIDRRHGLVSVWWGLFVHFRQTDYSLNGFRTVTLQEDIRSMGTYTSRHPVFIVQLEGEESPLLLDEKTSYREAHAMAARIAEFTQMPLQDSVDV